VRADLDRLMQERGLAGMVVLAHDRYSPAMYYATGQKIHFGLYFRTPDGRAHLIHDAMERDQSARVGCGLSSFQQHGLQQRIEREGHPGRAMGTLVAEGCGLLGIRGPIAFFGDTSVAYAYEMLERATANGSGILIDRDFPDILTLARATKADDEVARIRHAARGAVAGIERVREFLGGLRPAGDAFRACCTASSWRGAWREARPSSRRAAMPASRTIGGRTTRRFVPERRC
jgi:Xaa-Pro aminopeptidase